MRLFLVRHGETSWNAEGRFQGQIDTALNERGQSQAKSIAAHLAGNGFDVIVSSPLSRARLTAETIAGCYKASVVVDERLTEISHGDWEGLLVPEVETRWPELLKQWRERPEQVKMPGEHGETVEDVRSRAVLATENLLDKYDGNVCVVTHDAVIKALLCHYLEAPLSSFSRFLIANCSLTILDLEKSRAPLLVLAGDASHLGRGFNAQAQSAV